MSQKADAVGLTFFNDSKQTAKYHLNKKIHVFNHCLNLWNKRIGKITVHETFAFPKLIYQLTVLETLSEKTIKQIESLMYSFLWNSKPDKISRSQINQNYDKECLKMIDITKLMNALKVLWERRILTKKQTLVTYMNKFGSELFLNVTSILETYKNFH